MNGYRQNKRSLQSITYLLLSMLFLFTLTPAQPVFAFDAHPMTASANPTAPTDKGFALARVSVVRLLFSYTTDPNATPVATCPGLGVLVKSWPTSDAADPNNWVLTDGFLLDSTNSQVTCASNHPKGILAGFQVFLNTTFSGTEQPFSSSTAPVCVDQANCLKGPALVGFHTDTPLPFVDLAKSQASSSASGDRAIALTKDAAGPLPLPSEKNPTKFLTPQVFALNKAGLEGGTPFIDAAGNLDGLHPTNAGSSSSLSDISSLMTTKFPSSSPPPENPVNTNWNKGIDDYYNKNYVPAQIEFQSVVSANPNFQGASDFANFARGAANNPAPTPTPNPQQTSAGFVLPFINIAPDPWLLSALALLVLAVLFLIVSLIIRRRIELDRAFKAEIADADRRAELVAQQIKLLEAAQRGQVGRNRASEQPIIPIQPQGLQDKTVVRRIVSDLHCPNCGELVASDANFCPHCRRVLSPSESGLHLRVLPLGSSAQSSAALTPRVEFDTAYIRADINARQLTEQEGGSQP
jgi:hypothetical protein